MDGSQNARRSAPRRANDGRARIGRIGEELAAAHLMRLGYTLIERNARTRYGEIDLIARDRETIVFVEVKTRRTPGSWRAEHAAGHERQPDPLAWLRPRQQLRLRRLASAWLSDAQNSARPRARSVRFDAIGVVVERDGALVRLDHLEGAW